MKGTLDKCLYRSDISYYRKDKKTARVNLKLKEHDQMVWQQDEHFSTSSEVLGIDTALGNLWKQ